MDLRQLVERTGHSVPPWLEDLLQRGPRLETWVPPETRPNRVLITEFLARWLKAAGVSQEDCLNWLLPYCCEVLAQYSKSGPSAIRHGTKANVRWVYKSDFAFDFQSMAQEALQGKSNSNPDYGAVLDRWQELQVEAKAAARAAYRPPPFERVLPVKERFRAQFLAGLELARQQEKEGATLTAIVALLNERGLRTRTGRQWTVGILYRSLREAPKPTGSE